MSDDVVKHEYTPKVDGGEFVMKIAKEGQVTVDGRVFDKESITWRQPPLPLMFIRQNDPSGNGGHKASEAVGAITDIWSEVDEEGFATVYGQGYFSTDEAGQNARELIQEGVISGVSADIGGAIVEELDLDFDVDSNEPIVRKVIKAGELVAVTGLPIPAFSDMKISVTASSGPETWRPNRDWFNNPNLSEPTPITVTEDGRVFGHVATWGTCHVGYPGKCVTPPRSRSNYQYFNVGHVITDNGETVSVGRITAGTGHANLEFGAQPAVEHYDNTGWAGSYVHAGEDEHGIWVSGAVSPTATDEQIAVMRAASTSGDWRSIGGNLEMVGVLAVNSPGFPVPRTKVGLVAGSQVSLLTGFTAAAAGKDCGCGCDGSGDCAEKAEKEEMSAEEVTEIPEIDEAELVNWDVEVLFASQV